MIGSSGSEGVLLSDVAVLRDGQTSYTTHNSARVRKLSVLLPARRYASAGYRDRNVSVCLSVRHAPVLCQNEES